jgi:hypothetical protein
MNSVYALQIVEAVKSAEPGGDFIDHGWSLVKRLHEAGFDITPRDRGPAGLHPAKTLGGMCGLKEEG